MDAKYAIADTSNIFSPALLVYREIVDRNLRKMIAIAGGVGRLRPSTHSHGYSEFSHGVL